MITIGEKLPLGHLKIMGENGPIDYHTTEQFKDKTVILFAVPGAFTPTCSAAHLPGFVDNFDAFMQAGVDIIACVSVNDAFVMNAWGKSANADKIHMLGDGNATFSIALGLDKDASGHHMGTRSKRYAMILKNGVIEHLAVDEAGLKSTSAEEILALL